MSITIKDAENIMKRIYDDDKTVTKEEWDETIELIAYAIGSGKYKIAKKKNKINYPNKVNANYTVVDCKGIAKSFRILGIDSTDGETKYHIEDTATNDDFYVNKDWFDRREEVYETPTRK